MLKWAIAESGLVLLRGIPREAGGLLPRGVSLGSPRNR